MRKKRNLFFLAILLVILLSSLTIYAGDAIKIGDTIYAGDLSLTERTIREVDNNDNIEFLVGEEGYVLNVISNLPELVELSLEGTGDVTINLNQESSLVLPDGSVLFIRYLEYGRLDSKLKMRVESVGGGQTEETQTEEETDTNEEVVEEEFAESLEVNETSNTEVNKSSTGKFNLSKIQENIKNYWWIFVIVAVLGILIGFIAFIRRRGSVGKKAEVLVNNTEENSTKDEEPFFEEKIE